MQIDRISDLMIMNGRGARVKRMGSGHEVMENVEIDNPIRITNFLRFYCLPGVIHTVQHATDMKMSMCRLGKYFFFRAGTLIRNIM